MDPHKQGDEDFLGNRLRISIRQMEIDDLAEVYHLGEELFTSKTLPVLYRTWDPFEVTYYYNTDPEFCLVAETEDEELIGFALGSTVDKDGSPWRYGYLAWLGVKKEYQGKKVAHRLLKEFERRMKEEGVRMLLVDTEGDNTRAMRFFQSNGFSRPTAHVWLTKSLSRQEVATMKPLKPLKPLAASKAKRSGGATRNGKASTNGHGKAMQEMPGLVVVPETA